MVRVKHGDWGVTVFYFYQFLTRNSRHSATFVSNQIQPWYQWWSHTADRACQSVMPFAWWEHKGAGDYYYHKNMDTWPWMRLWNHAALTDNCIRNCYRQSIFSLSLEFAQLRVQRVFLIVEAVFISLTTAPALHFSPLPAILIATDSAWRLKHGRSCLDNQDNILEQSPALLR